MKGNRKNLLLLALALALVLTVPPLSGNALAVDLDKDCVLTVEAGSIELEEDLAEANVVIDLYQAARAVAVPGSDTYSYEMLTGFEDLVIGEEMNDAAWEALAQQAAKTALNSELVLPVQVGVPAGDKFSGLDAGLYLVIARGADLEDYVTVLETEKEEAPEGSAPEQTDSEKIVEELIATKAESKKHIYTFLPELVSIPTKEPDENGIISTANPGDWIYDPLVTLKPVQSPRLGSLEIVKGLDGYVTGRPATFVFQVEAVMDGRNVFSDVFSINFGSEGTKSIQVDGIPIGAEVTVTEIYSGVVYRAVSDVTQKTVIDADEIVSVRFDNTPGDEDKNGGSVTNSFEYVDGGWKWQAIPDTP